ncbi:MAG TPA: GGDEF domain-containing protein [Gemmatimonadales bacterium]|nr:GGDEF domain-containing protein [Gemmatimonadales bacterium]
MSGSPAGVWVGRGLALLGLVAVVAAVRAASLWALLAAAGGVLAATGWALGPLVRLWAAERPLTRPADFAHVLDLVRRAHGARAAWLVGLPEGDLEAVGAAGVDAELRRRGAAIVQLASVDGRAHVERESQGTYVAVGDFPFGGGVLLTEPDTTSERAELVHEELRRVVAGMRLAQQHEAGEQPGQLVAKQLAALAAGAQTLDGIAKAAVQLAQQFAQRGTAIVLQGVAPAAGGAQVVAVSRAADARLAGLSLPADAPALRAVTAGIPVVTEGAEDIFGSALPDRRRQERAGTAYPVFDGHFPIGALVVLGPPLAVGAPAVDQLRRLVAELGSRLAAARAVYEAEQRAVRDPLTGLRNRREFERALPERTGTKPPAAATLIYADLDRFKQLNDTLGHAAGDAALRHVARILEAAVRDKDLVARIGGEEFAVWMPDTPMASGLEVAERIRETVEATEWRWSGEAYPLTVSCGVAALPDTVRDPANLRAAADAALYRAKQAGRNRVAQAPSAEPASVE